MPDSPAQRVQIVLAPGAGPKARRFALCLVALAFCAWLAYQARDVWLPVIAAFLIAMVLDPVVDKMEARGWKRLNAVILIYILFFAAVGGALTAAVPPIISQSNTISTLVSTYLPAQGNSPRNVRVTRIRLDRLMKRMHAPPFVRSGVEQASAEITTAFTRAVQWFGAIVQSLVTNLLWLVLIPLISFYALKDLHLIYARVLLIFPQDQRTTVQNFLNEVSAIFVRYLRGLVVVCVLNALATMAVLYPFGAPDAIGLGAIAGTLYMVPYIGPVATYIIVGSVCLLAHKPVLPILAILILLHSVIFDQIITPRILGRHVGIHPILAILALIVGLSLMGFVGMIIAVPVAATMQMIALALVPRLNASVDVPSADQIHAPAEPATPRSEQSDELGPARELHKGIVEAVDTAAAAEEEAHASGDAPAPFTSEPAPAHKVRGSEH